MYPTLPEHSASEAVRVFSKRPPLIKTRRRAALQFFDRLTCRQHQREILRNVVRESLLAIHATTENIQHGFLQQSKRRQLKALADTAGTMHIMSGYRNHFMISEYIYTH